MVRAAPRRSQTAADPGVAGPTRPASVRRRRRARPRVRPGLAQLLASLELHPAYVVGPRTEVLA